jgi:hypothetical protein
MTYRVFSGPRGSVSVSALERERWLHKTFDTLDAAFAWARHVNASGRVVLLIEGDDGTHLARDEIAYALRHREAEL